MKRILSLVLVIILLFSTGSIFTSIQAEPVIRVVRVNAADGAAYFNWEAKKSMYSCKGLYKYNIKTKKYGTKNLISTQFFGSKRNGTVQAMLYDIDGAYDAYKLVFKGTDGKTYTTEANLMVNPSTPEIASAYYLKKDKSVNVKYYYSNKKMTVKYKFYGEGNDKIKKATPMYVADQKNNKKYFYYRFTRKLDTKRKYYILCSVEKKVTYYNVNKKKIETKTISSKWTQPSKKSLVVYLNH